MTMAGAVIAVTTANRPEILNRCVGAATACCDVAREAHWIVLDDSISFSRDFNREVVRSWRSCGLTMTYIDAAVEEEMADSLPESSLRGYFTHLMAKPPSYRIPGVRNLALLTGLSLSPELLFFIDDDMVHRHEHNGTCFFHWCKNGNSGASFVATAHKRGIADMTYPNRLLKVLDRDNWLQFLSRGGITADSETWYSPQNPLWKNSDDRTKGISEIPNQKEVATTRPKEAVSTQLLAIRDRGGEWVPFPSGHNEDFNWSFVQSWLHGTPLLQVRGGSAQHLPPSIGYAGVDAFVSELIGTARTRVLREIKPLGKRSLKILADRFQDGLELDLKPEAFLVLGLEASIRFRTDNCSTDANAIGILANIAATLIEVKERLKTVDGRYFLSAWLRDIDDRHKMFLELRRSERVRDRIRRILKRAST